MAAADGADVTALSARAGADLATALQVGQRHPDGSLTVRGMGHGGRIRLSGNYRQRTRE